MASLQATPSKPQAQDEKNLTCGICQDVYVTPRLLPCFHTFCSPCLGKLLTTLNSSSFACPTCRKPVPVPEEGVGGFQCNMYITQRELDRAKEYSAPCGVQAHFDEPLTLYCLTCNKAICFRCKITSHEGHHCEDLVRGAELDKRLVGVKQGLDTAIKTAEKDIQDVEFNLREVKRKGVALKEQVHCQYDTLVSMAERLRDQAVKDVNKWSEDMQLRLFQHRNYQTYELETFKNQRTRVRNILSKVADGSDCEEDVEQVLGKCEDWEQQGKFNVKVFSQPFLRPGLNCRLNSIREGDIQSFMGQSFVLVLAAVRSPIVTITKFFRCVDKGRVRQIYSLCATNDKVVHCMYGDSSPSCNQWGKRSIGPTGQVLSDTKVGQKFIFRKFPFGRLHCISHNKLHFSLWLNSKSGSSAQVRYIPPSASNKVGSCGLYEVMVKDHFLLKHPKLDNVHFIQTLNTGQPLAMDINMDGSLVVIVEEVNDSLPQRDTVHNKTVSRIVRLYRRGQENHVATFAPPYDHFLPSDVCFWQHNEKEKLLVADYMTDSVLVLSALMVNSRKGCFHLEHNLASGCGDLVKPTALETDSCGALWIGCANGWILKCEAIRAAEDRGSALKRKAVDEEEQVQKRSMGESVSKPNKCSL